jgi:hypothetical protein
MSENKQFGSMGWQEGVCGIPFQRIERSGATTCGDGWVLGDSGITIFFQVGLKKGVDLAPYSE